LTVDGDVDGISKPYFHRHRFMLIIDLPLISTSRNRKVKNV